MKIVITIAEYGAYINTGAAVERKSFIVEIPDNQLPAEVLNIDELNRCATISLSILKESN